MSTTTTFPPRPPIQYINADNGNTYAYRVHGPPITQTAIPLIMHIHFRGNMDFWDPALLTPLSAHRPVLTFDNTGIGRSTGSVPKTYAAWAEDLLSLTRALHIPRFDLFGFSMGGRAVQMVALAAPHAVRRLVLAGTDPSAPPSASDEILPRGQSDPTALGLLGRAAVDDVREPMSRTLFPLTERGQAAAAAYWARVSAQTNSFADGAPLLKLLAADPGSRAQVAASEAWAVPGGKDGSFARLRGLNVPTLVVNGSDDLLIPTARSWELVKLIPNAQLVIYPRSGHGFLYQYAGLLAEHVNRFLDGTEAEDLAKL